MITKMKNFWNSLDGTTSISKRELFLEIMVAALTGLVLGMIFTPRKNVTGGRHNSGNGCNCGNAGLTDADEEAEA